MKGRSDGRGGSGYLGRGGEAVFIGFLEDYVAFSINTLELTPEHSAVGNGYSEILVEEGVEPFCGFFPLGREERGVWVFAHDGGCM